MSEVVAPEIIPSTMPRTKNPNMVRYFQFSLLLLSAGAIYPLLYLRQNFETTLLEALHINSSHLGQLYSLLGIIYTLTYLPSGWLADKFSPRLLLTLSMLGVGFFGLWFATFPSFFELRLIFIGWGLAAGLTFWASLIKGVKLLAAHNEQGRFFGILDGGRGLIEAVLASAAMGLFTHMSGLGGSTQDTLRPVILFYAIICLVIGVAIYFFLDKDKNSNDKISLPPVTLLQNLTQLGKDLKLLFSLPQLLPLAVIVFTGYQLFWATYSFSAFLQVDFGLSALAAGTITVAKLWTRPFGGICAGYLGDKYSKEKVLFHLYWSASLGLISFIFFPKLQNTFFLLLLVLLIGFLTYAIRGLYWALLDRCPIPPRLTGLAIGIVSLIGFMPDILLPLLEGTLTQYFSREMSFRIYFAYIAVSGFAGALICLFFYKRAQSYGNKLPTISPSQS